MLSEIEARKIIAMMQATWPTNHITEFSWRSYQLALDDLEYLHVEQAVREAMRTERFCPVPAVLRDICGANRPKHMPAPIAWGIVMDQVRRTGSYGLPTFNDPAIARAVEIFGWQAICATEDKDMPALRRHWYDTYTAQTLGGSAFDELPALPDSTQAEGRAADAALSDQN